MSVNSTARWPRMLCGVPLMAHAPWSSGSRSSPGKRIDRKQWVKDQLLGLASEKPDLNLFPELFRGCAALIVLKTAEPSPGLGLVAETMVSRRQEGVVLSIALAAAKPDSLFQQVNRLLEMTREEPWGQNLGVRPSFKLT